MDLAIDQRGAGNRRSLATGWAGIGLTPVSNVAAQASLLTSRRAGLIVAENGRLSAIHGRWWPYAGNVAQVLLDTHFRSVRNDRCEAYYHHSSASSAFITLSYIRSGPQTSMSTLYAAALVLDEIARLKQSSAIVCHVTNRRISDRFLNRWGWQQHCRHWTGRHFIKRMYGVYPVAQSSWRSRLTLD